MNQTLKTLINSVAAEVCELQDTKADRIELNAYIKTVTPETIGAIQAVILSLSSSA